jgi:hypothetical protein
MFQIASPPPMLLQFLAAGCRAKIFRYEDETDMDPHLERRTAGSMTLVRLKSQVMVIVRPGAEGLP